jgi:peptide/nickel transport system substrate-binding protein
MKSTFGFLSNKKVTSAIAVVGLATSVVAGTAISAKAAPVTGGTLVYVTNASQLNHLDPQRVYTGQDIAFLNSYVFRSLDSYAPVPGQAGFKLVPDLATTIGTPSDGGKTWSWTLKSGIKWQDGSPLTCADEKYGISRAFATDVITDGPSYAIQDLNIPTDAKGNPMYLGPYKKTGQAYYDKAVTCSGNTLTVHLNKPVGDFNYFGTYPAMSPVKQSADTGAKYDNAPWALGPYKVASYKIGSELDLVRNPNWSQATDNIRHAYPDKIQMRFGVSENVRDQIFLNDTVKNAVNYDQGLLPQDLVKFYNNPKNASRGNNQVSPYTRYYAFNISAGHLDCLDVRKAIFFSWPIQGLIDLSGGSKFYGTIGDNPIDPLVPDYAKTTGNVHDSNFEAAGNPDYAKTLLTQAQTDCPDTYKRVTTTGFSIDIPDNATSRKAATLIQNALNAAGLQVNFNFIQPGVYYPTVQDTTKQGDMSRAGWAADWANASTVIPDLFLKDGGFDLDQNWNDPAYADFAAKAVAAQGETNRAKQTADWRALAQFVMDQYWISTPIFNVDQYQWGSKVGGAQYWLPQGALIFTNLYVNQ